MARHLEKYLNVESRVSSQGEVTQDYWNGKPEQLVPRCSKYYFWLKEKEAELGSVNKIV